MASAALYSASLRRAAAAATATKSSTSPEATASLSCLQWKISSCSTHSAPHVRSRRPVAAAAAGVSSRASARNAIHWNRDPHPSSKCPSFPKENPSRHKICAIRRRGGCAATRLRRLQKEVALCWVILPIYYLHIAWVWNWSRLSFLSYQPK